jgi:hypothetical protein
MGFRLQKSADTCVGNIENEDGTAGGFERKLVHPRGRWGVHEFVYCHSKINVDQSIQPKELS